jgi:hypothetical protein
MAVLEIQGTQFVAHVQQIQVGTTELRYNHLKQEAQPLTWSTHCS